MSSMDTMMEDEDPCGSNTDAIIFGTSDHSGWAADSMISGPNIVLSSTSTDEQYQQQISTAVDDGGDDSMTVSSGASSSWFMNSNEQSEVRIFNVDFRALSGVALRSTSKDKEKKGSGNNQRACTRSEFHGGLLEKIGGAVNEEGRTMFDSMGNSGSAKPNSQDSEMVEQYLGREIYNVVACEGTEWDERHETLFQWRVRMYSAGFIPVQLG